MAERCLKSHRCIALATAAGLQNWVLANWTILCSLLLKMIYISPSNSTFYWLITKNDRGTERETLSQAWSRLLHWQTPFVTVTLTVRSLITVAPRSLYHFPTHSLLRERVFKNRTVIPADWKLPESQALLRSRRISYLLELKSHNLWYLKPETETLVTKRQSEKTDTKSSEL